MKRFTAITIIIFLLMATTAAVLVPLNLSNRSREQDFYLGVSFNGNTTAEGKLLIDRVKSYTNLFVLQSFPISRNETAIYEILDYATSQGLNIVVNLLSSSNQSDWYWQFEVFKSARHRWGSLFLGAYYSDEPAGLQLDYNWTDFFDTYKGYFANNASRSGIHQVYAKLEDAMVNGTKPQNYDLEASVFFNYFNYDKAFIDLQSTGIKIFVSDYTLYWFDYMAGYDVVLAQFGSNSSYVEEVDLVRGAARLQNKEWGAILTWKYSEPPYLDTGEEIHRQMLEACKAGAKYIIIFNYPQLGDNPYGVMQEEHFKALESVANDVMATAKLRTISDESQAEAVLVLPRNYGWGMRRPDDVIWGFWPPDEKSAHIWDVLTKLILQYELRLDIVYDDPAFPVTGKYNHIYYWNQTL